MSKEILKKLGNRIKELRQLKGLTQQQFAEKIDIETNSLSALECGKTFLTINTLEKITNVLEIEPNELFNFSPNTENEDMYEFILKKINYIKGNKQLLSILYKFLKSL